MQQELISTIKNKIILVTGGTGSFGKTFVKEILNHEPREVIVFSRDEAKQGTMRLEYAGEHRLRFILGDVRDYKSLREAVRGIDIIIHAAALKWVTEAEYNVWEAVRTNVFGTQNVILAAKEENIEKVVSLSTDKAVQPINAYGMTKAIQERLITTANLYETNIKTIFVSTRYGNVLGSCGSVVPLFKSLISDLKPLTITDPNMTRFVLTLQESVELVLAALKDGVGGEIFVKKMPAHTITTLAEIMLRNVLNKTIINIGIRPGEKIHETLISSSESSRTVKMGEFFVILPEIEMPAILEKYGDMMRLQEPRYSSDNAKQLSSEELMQILKSENYLS